MTNEPNLVDQMIQIIEDHSLDVSRPQKGELVLVCVSRIVAALAAKLAEAQEDRDDLQIALASARKQLERYIAEAEAALAAANKRISELESQND